MTRHYEAPISSIEIFQTLDLQLGGITSSVSALSAAMSRSGFVKATVVALMPEEQYRGKSVKGGENIAFLPTGRLRWIRESGLRAQLDQLAAEASVMHIHGLWQEHSLVAASAARRLSMPYVVSAHGMLDSAALRAKRWKKELYAALFERRRLRRAAILRAFTQSEVDSYRQFGLRVPAVVIPNGISVPEHASSQLFLNTFAKLAGKRLILYMARLHPHKGPHLLLRAWSRIENRFPDAHLVLAGPDELGTQRSLEQLLQDLEISNRVTFTGPLTGDLKWSCLAAAHGFILPSLSEAFSVGVLEALACSVPVILTRGCNFPEVASSQAGFIIDREEREIESALSDLLRLTPDERAAMGARGLGLVHSKYSLTSVARSMADIYEWLCGGSLPQSVEIHYA